MPAWYDYVHQLALGESTGFQITHVSIDDIYFIMDLLERSRIRCRINIEPDEDLGYSHWKFAVRIPPSDDPGVMAILTA